MGSFGQDWGTLAYTAITGLNAASVAASTTVTGSDAISSDGKVDTEISVEIAYGTVAATYGAEVYVLRDADGTNYEVVADNPWGFAMPKTASTTHRRVFTVPASVGRFKIAVKNTDGTNAITATVRYRQANGETA